jgi:hypothetical protein
MGDPDAMQRYDMIQSLTVHLSIQTRLLSSYRNSQCRSKMNKSRRNTPLHFLVLSIELGGVSQKTDWMPRSTTPISIPFLNHGWHWSDMPLEFCQLSAHNLSRPSQIYQFQFHVRSVISLEHLSSCDI